jgi:Tol biopolymer transport system component
VKSRVSAELQPCSRQMYPPSPDIFVRDLVLGTTSRVNVALDGSQANNASYDPAISGDGRYVSFYSDATNLVSDDTNGIRDVFVVDGFAQGWWFA